MALNTSQPIRTILPGRSRITTASGQQRYARFYVFFWYLGMFGLSGLVTAALILFGPTPAAIGWLIFLGLIAAVLYNPRYGIYTLVGFCLAGDGALTPWFPMMKNLSSGESLLFLHSALIFNLAEFFIALTIASWLGRAIAIRKLNLVLGHLVVPAMVFFAFIAFGFIMGIAKGGDFGIALWSTRAIFYFPLVLLLVSQLIQTRAQTMMLIWVAALGIAFDALNGALFVTTVLKWDIESVLRIAEHSHSIHINSLFVLLVVLFYFHGSPQLRWFLLLVLPLLAISYMGNQRRASYVAIVLAFLLFGLLLQWYNRRAFWMVVPPLALLFTLYLGIFWNSTAAPAWAAEQVRGIVAPVEGSEDESSNLYRELENMNNLFTIRQEPLTGVGFGRKFYIIAPMADISFFIWWEYIVHNSVMWIWMDAGIGAFLSLLFLWGSGIVLGFRRMFEIPPGDMRAVAFVAVSFLVMHATYAYVDMSWDGQSMIYLGAMMGLINVLDRIVAAPELTPPRRWPWQAQPSGVQMRS